MVGSENTTALPPKGAPASPVYELGRLLGAIITEGRRADGERLAGSPHAASAADARERANDDAREAIERLILAAKAASLPDAAVHALMLRMLADDVETAVRDGNDVGAQRALWTIERIARSIFDVLARDAGINEAELAADFFLNPAERLWPATAAGDLFGTALTIFDAEAGPMIQLPADPAGDVLEAAAGAAGLPVDVVRRVWGALAGIAGRAQEA